MDARLKETMTNLVKNSPPEEVVGIIMTHIQKVQLLERKIGKLELENSMLRNESTKNVLISSEG